MATEATEGRRYRGMTAEDRVADRRARLLDAGLELFGTQGYAQTTIEEVCTAGGVTARHLYEQFGGREELLLAVYERIITEHTEIVLGALAQHRDDVEHHARAGVQAAVDAWTSDERRLRVAFVEVVGVTPAVEARRLEVIEAYAQLLADDISRLADAGLLGPRDFYLGALAVVGAVTQLMTTWVHKPPAARPPTGLMVDEVTRMLVAAARS